MLINLSALNGSAGYAFVIKGIEYFRTAIRLDPDYAAAFAGLADALVMAGSIADMMTPQEARKQAQDAALHALQLDSTSAEAYSALGFMSLMFESNWQAAEDNLKRAVGLNPSNTGAYRWYSLYLTALGRHEEAISSSQFRVR
ncbi:MAG: tetratricopeptide repeat protein, partial [bacterium]